MIAKFVAATFVVAKFLVAKFLVAKIPDAKIPHARTLDPKTIVTLPAHRRARTPTRMDARVRCRTGVSGAAFTRIY